MKKTVFSSLLLVLSLLSLAQSKADRTLVKQLDALIQLAYPSIAPGCVVLVARKGQVIYEKAFGMANLELQVPMQPDMVFRLGSVTKQYTAIAILQLAEQGKLSLQDSLQKFITGFPNKGHAITIEHLLTHTSGIIDYEALNTPEANAPFMQRHDLEPAAIIDLFKKEPLAFVPGTQFSYSNSNYFLLGAIIEKVSGKTYRDYLEQQVLRPAGLLHTYYGSYREIIPGRVSGYAGHRGKFGNADYLSMTIAYAAGALMSNVADLLQWQLALHAGKLVKPETLEKAFTSYKLSNDSATGYGYGWFIKTRDGNLSIEHAGGIDGFQSEEIYLPGPDIFIATLYNALNEGGDDPAFLSLTNDIATLAAGKSLQKEITLPDSVLQAYVGVYEFDPAHHIVVTLENNRLQMEAAAGGLPKSPLFAKSENLFFLKITKADIEFVKEANGKVVSLVAHSSGKNEVCKKIK